MNNSHLPQLQQFVLVDQPFEIASRIFSWLDQQECLTCMTVCRSWYSTVPQYSRDVWATLNLSLNREIHPDNKRWDLCLGSHVKTITLEYGFDESNSDQFSSSESDHEPSDSDRMAELMEADRRLCRVMQRLIDCGCDQVKSLEFKECPVSSERTFLILLKQLAQTATDLTFHRHEMGPDVIDLLDSCPNLTFFSFRHGDYDNRLICLFTGPPKTDEFTNLKQLSVEIRDDDLQKQLIPVLQKSPNLEYLAYHSPDSYDIDDVFHNTAAIPVDHIALWCPKLISLELSPMQCGRYEADVIQQYSTRTNDGSPGLRSLIASETEYVGPVVVGPFLLHNANTLESISLIKYSDNVINDWSSIFSRAKFPYLRTLELYAIGINDAATNRLLANCPALEMLYIYAAENPPMIHLAQALQNLTQLKTIEFQSVQLAYDNIDASVASRSKVERIDFRDVIPVTDTLLQRLPWLQSLKQLHLYFSESRQDHTDAGLYQFIEMLSRTKLQILQLEGLQTLHANAIQALGNLPCLEWMILCGPEESSLMCDGPSLVQALDNCKSLKWAKFSHLELIGDDMSLLAYLKQELKTYKEVRNMPTIGGVCILK